jgi:predicted RNA binding protein YcfA (HicA-like mRNA interferase family)
MKKVVFIFGRFQVPTKGHAEMIHYGLQYAKSKGAEFRVYTSKSHDAVKNPLPYKTKVGFLRQLFPGLNVVDDPQANTAFAICKKLSDEGYDDVVMITGGDRVAEFKRSIGKYVLPRNNPKFDPKKNYGFTHFDVINSGERKAGISGTDMRKFIKTGQFDKFMTVAPTTNRTLARKIFNAAKKNLAEGVEINELTSRDMHKHLTSKGWTLDRKGKRHDLYSHPQSKGRRITLPRHPGELDRRLQKEIDKQTDRYIREETGGMSRKDFHDKLMSFIDFTCNHLGIDEKPHLQYMGSDENGDKNPVNQPSFASYSPTEKMVRVSTKNRHPMDIFRSVAHELVHHKQNLDGRLGKNIAKEGATGSKIENEANSEAGKVMRYFGAENPFYFDMQYVVEKAIILSGTPGSGKDRILKEAILPFGFNEISADNFHKESLQGNVVVNGTSDYLTIKTIKEALELKGYQTIMVFVNTSNEVSKQRNEARASKGGRVITETVRFAKWKGAQDALDKFDQLFEKVIEVKNDLDLNLHESVIDETYKKLISNVSKEIEEFTKSDTDRKFENMLNEVGGAGNWGTQQLTDKYKSDTPGQEPGKFAKMKVLKLTNKIREERPSPLDPRGQNPGPIGGDRIGDEAGMPKGPGFGDNQSLDFTGVNGNRQIDRWMVKEETRRMFKAKYGALADKKIKETADRLKRESLDDPYSGGMSDVSVTGGPPENVRPDVKAEYEKISLFGKKRFKKYKNTK